MFSREMSDHVEWANFSASGGRIRQPMANKQNFHFSGEQYSRDYAGET
jgi:hypothetical protein